jgi:lipopolysaccharide export LptBFGC system permease protein LptF
MGFVIGSWYYWRTEKLDKSDAIGFSNWIIGWPIVLLGLLFWNYILTPLAEVVMWLDRFPIKIASYKRKKQLKNIKSSSPASDYTFRY